MKPEYYDPETYPSEWNFLQAGTILDEYMIERPLAGGGFSSVYLARQRLDQHQVVIKEYLPRRLAHRTWQNQIVPNSEETRPQFLRGKTLFVEEAKALGKLKHPNIVEVLNFFSANSTIYLVMAYDYGINLANYIKNKKGKLSENFMMTVFPALLDGMEIIHEACLLHLDIKPDNILIRPGGDPLLLDFGAVHPYPRVETWKPGKVLTNGFSPPEQYPRDGDVGPWSDIYATGATMRTCIEGYPPPAAPERTVRDTLKPAALAFRKKYSPALLETIDASLEIEPANRPQSIAELMERLSNV
ncbi:MAG: serine/threonine protein kinase [Methylococcaceae bacterium]|nr:serine/threonine protein kinase [Methylococcaceae bacterium]MCI0668350.1 serine/threonine protein kinase [Methylococcaceae bacterium]MCI0733140.1 serine/threonine protein kinase [Methylococcaceae bacterium]